MNKTSKKLFYFFLPLFFSLLSFSGFCQIGKALVLDGCTNYLEISDDDLLDFNGNLTIECWIQPNCKNDNNVILSKEWCGGGGQFGYYLSVNNGKLFWAYSYTGNCTFPNTFQTVNNPIQVDRFTHVAVVHTQQNIRLFIDGNEAASEQKQGIFSEIFNSNQPLRIGAYRKLDGQISNYYSGLMDELRVWNIALDENTIQQRKDQVLIGNEPGLVVYFDMEDSGQGSSLVLKNKSGFGATFNATAKGFNNYSPFLIFNEAYNTNLLDIGRDQTLCDDFVSLSVNLNDYKGILWNTGSTAPSINVNTSGIYFVNVETERCKFFRDTVEINFSNAVLFSQAYTICENDSILINGQFYDEPGVFYDTIQTNTVCDTIFEYQIFLFDSDQTYINIATCPNSIFIYNNQQLVPGTITDFVFTNTYGCDSIVTLEISPTLVLKDSIYLSACENEAIEYQGVPLYANTKTDFNLQSVEGCDSIVTVIVGLKESPGPFLEEDQIICSSEYAIISAFENTLWEDGSVSQTYTAYQSGNYIGILIDSSNCLAKDTIHLRFINRNHYIPNAFSPNNDAVNDFFKPYFSASIEWSNYTFRIYNRWGAEVFLTSDPEDAWDGIFKGKYVNPGVYVWVIKGFNSICMEEEFLTGSVNVIK